jgi:crotonobetainyl-CoA:carnitine CoA-transferase CaiB-like acyl-CoA transferase
LWTVGADVQRVAALGAPLPYDQRIGPENPLWNPYPTSDGKWIMLALHPNFDFDRVCLALGDQQLREDPRYSTAELRKSHSREMVEALDRIFRTRTRDEWDRRFQEADLIWAPVMMPQEIIETEQGREAFFDAEHPAVGHYRLLRSPINFSRTPGRFRRRAPNHGEHTVEVLREIGMTPDEIERVTNSAK